MVVKLPAFEVCAAVGVVVVADDEPPPEQLERVTREEARAAEDRRVMNREGSERVFIFMAKLRAVHCLEGAFTSIATASWENSTFADGVLYHMQYAMGNRHPVMRREWCQLG